MPTVADPVAGRWYHNRSNDLRFMVLALDADDEAVEIQYDDGEVEAFPLAEWYQSPMEPSEAPEDPRPVMDVTGTDEWDYVDLGDQEVPPENAGDRYRREVVERAGKSWPGSRE